MDLSGNLYHTSIILVSRFFVDVHHLYLIGDFNCQPNVQRLWGAQEAEQILFIPSVSCHM